MKLLEVLKSRVAIGALVATLSLAGLAHEGHDQPGAMPSAPHGGKVKEAMAGGKKSEGSELFFEVVFEGSKLTLYPLTLPADDPSAFKGLSPAKDISNILVQVEFPRSKRIDKVAAKVGPQSIEAAVNAKGATRFLVHVSATHQGTNKKAKIQVEVK